MKRSMYAMLVVALAVAAGARTLRAAGPGQEQGDRKAEMNARMLDHLKTRLGLSDEEASKVKTIFEDSRKASQPVHQQLKVALEKLRWQVDAKADDKDLEATLSQIDKSRKALAEARDKMIARLNKELPVQARAKLALFKAEQMSRRVMMRRHGMIGGPGRVERGWGGPGAGPSAPPPPPPPGDDGQGE